MKFVITLLPTVFLLSYGQLVSKWRVNEITSRLEGAETAFERLFIYIFDPFVISAYVSTFFSSIVWFYVLESYPVSLAFPASVGAVFVVVILGGGIFLREPLALQHLLGVLLIISGLIVASRA